MSGLLSSEPNDELSTEAGEVTTPLSTGHTLTPVLEFMGVKVLVWSVYFMSVCLCV